MDAIRSMNVRNTQIVNDRMGIRMDTDGSYYCQVLSGYVGLSIEGEYRLIQTLNGPANMQEGYEKV